MKILHAIVNYIAITLLVLMGVVVVSRKVKLAYEILTSIIEPPGFFVGISEMLDIFGLFLMILIGLELMTSIQMYLNDHAIHAEMMFLVAMTAVTRKIVMVYETKSEPRVIFGIGFLVVSLSAGYYLVKRRNRDAVQD